MDEGRILLIAAHPDDETIGAGVQITRWPANRLTLAMVTDGSPRFVPNQAEYAATRRAELYTVLALAGRFEVPFRDLGFVDQEAYLHLPELVSVIGGLCDEIRPDAVYTHPYEGGHPDHDAAAFAVACALRTRPAIRAKEFTSYHRGPHGFESGVFLLNDGNIKTCIFTEAERSLKRRMFECYRSQEAVLRNFQTDCERFRDAPDYDFLQPPHPGQLHYETLDWNITGEDWRSRAAQALETLSMRDPQC